MTTTKHMAYALLALLAAACGKEEFDIATTPPEDALVEMSFTATAATATRTALGEGSNGKYSVMWTAGDAIAVMRRFGYYDASEIAEMKFTSSIEGETAAAATFTGRTEAGEYGYFAFYPHGSLIRYDYYNEYYVDIHYTLPTEQPAVAGTFAPNLCPAYAETTQEGGHLTFKPLCGLVKFRLSGDVGGLESVRFEAAGQELSGEMGFEVVSASFDNDAPALHVTLTGPFAAGEDYYMVVASCRLSDGFSFTFTRNDGSVYVKGGRIAGGFIGNGEIGDFGVIELREADFGTPSADDITDMSFIQALEAGSTPQIEFTRNASGYVPVNEENLQKMASVAQLDIRDKGFADGSVLKYFTGLKRLDCAKNGFTELDVSAMTDLEYLDCSENQLQALDVSTLPNLSYLNCGTNQLPAMDVSALQNLEYLNCRDNQLSTLNISGLTNVTELYCPYNRLTELDVSAMTKLKYMNCCDNELTRLKVTGATALVYLICGYNKLSELDVSGLTNMTDMECNGNLLSELDASSLTSLTFLNCDNNMLTELHISPLTNLKYLGCCRNRLTELDISDATELRTLHCYDNMLTRLDVSGLTNLEFLSCYANRLSELDISPIAGLLNISCGMQTSDGTAPQTLTLTLTAEQEKGVWEMSMLYDENREYNESVTLNVLQQ